MSIKDWSTSAAGNSTVAGINWAEGQAPSTVNNSAREMMAQLRTEYQSERWGWVAHSGTASANVATQTRVSVAANITADAVANRKVKLTGGSTTVYANIVSSSFTSETHITIENPTSALSASHSVVWLSSVYDKNLPGNVVTGSGTATLSTAIILGEASFRGSASFSASVYFVGPVHFDSSVTFSKTAFFNGTVAVDAPLVLAGGGSVGSATLSIGAGFLTVGGTPITGATGGSAILFAAANSAQAAYVASGSFSAYTSFEIFFDSGPGSATGSIKVSVATSSMTYQVDSYILGGTSQQTREIQIRGNTSILLDIYRQNALTTRIHTGTVTSGAFYINEIRIWAENGGTTVTGSANVIITAW